MATQAALIADTIVGMKRALRREREGKPKTRPFLIVEKVAFLTCHSPLDSGPDDAITQPTNRGNKMKANAKYVREGALGYINAEEFYKEVRGCSFRQQRGGGACLHCAILKDVQTNTYGLDCK